MRLLLVVRTLSLGLPAPQVVAARLVGINGHAVHHRKSNLSLHDIDR